MKYEVKFTTQFKKDLKLAKKQGKDTDRLFAVIEKLANGEPLEAKFADETGTHCKGFFDIFIVRRVISPKHRVAVCILLPCAEHKAVLFAVGRRQYGISEGGKLSGIGDAVGFHLRCVFVESDIFPHRRNLILNVCNFTAVFIREVLVGVA